MAELMDQDVLIPTKEEILKKVETLEEDLESFASFKTSGVTASRLAQFAQGLVRRAEELSADLLLDIELDEQDQARATALVEKTKKVGGSYVRAWEMMPEEEVPAPTAPSGGNTSGDRKRGTHLKRLELPTFKGDIREWTNFWSRFDKAVHGDPERDDGEKLQYFEMALEGEAVEFLNGFSKTPEDYPLIIRSFQERYSNKDLLAQAYNRDLHAIPAPGPSWREQRACLDEIVKILTCLRKIGTHVNEDSIRGLILQKFPAATLSTAYAEAQLMRLIGVLSEGPQALNPEVLEPAIECLRLPLDTQIEAMKRALLRLEYFSEAKKDELSPTAVTLATRSTTSKAGTSGTQSSGTSTAKPKVKRTICQLCSRENHRPKACRQFRTVTQRKAQIENLRLCYCCLGSDHNVASCPVKKPCPVCAKGMHHACICPDGAALKKAATANPAAKSKASGSNQQHGDGK